MHIYLQCKNTQATHTNIMAETHIFFISILLLASFIYLFKFLKHQNGKNLPPSPPSIPIIGHLHLMNGHIHRVLQNLSSKYGPVMALRFGFRPVLIISSPSAAEECFTKNDIVLANRPLLVTGKYLDYDHSTVGVAPYGQLWRDLRRVMTLELFSTARLKSYLGVREDEVRSLIKNLYKDCFQDFAKVEMRSRIQALSFNVVMKVVADKQFYGTGMEDNEEAAKFKDVMRDVFEIIGTPNPGDFFPFLRWIDFQGFEKRLKKLQDKTDSFSQNLIEEIRAKRSSSSSEKGNDKTFIDALLTLQESQPDYYTDNIIKGNISTLLQAGTDTSSVTIEWAMALLLNHPNVLERARAELDNYIGQERLVQETDLTNLPYIQCIISETLRLFPSAPLLVPHESSQDCIIGGFHVTRGTMVFVNAWAIHRDPIVWNDPLSFKPERFETGGNEGYRFIPFGMGRRQCPGSGLANRVVGLALASLIQCFEWERVGEELVDLSEGKGLTMPKDEPLEAMCRARQKMSHLVKDL
ncbi:putative cytochrome P450 [Helianthus annuus]|uniref:Cytochrome P450 n=2 Tax=Helianthus annuus TaxID=4232 RepID=A0A251VEB8_HELAN|nr:putative cytochrome P450 [Helianthus annuus]KAJ0776492.1 putative cytochrome P450 [Helianthus annuus]KAJ0938993.1 putative cytochrome P450 [Helianthus annuus]